MNRVDVREAVTRVHHGEWARAVAALARRFGDLDIAEEAAAEAFATAGGRLTVCPQPGGVDLGEVRGPAVCQGEHHAQD